MEYTILGMAFLMILFCAYISIATHNNSLLALYTVLLVWLAILAGIQFIRKRK